MKLGFLKTLSFIKGDNPAIYDTKKRFFNDDEEDGDGKEKVEGAQKAKKAKPMYLKDYEREQVLAQAAKGFASEEDEDGKLE